MPYRNGLGRSPDIQKSSCEERPALAVPHRRALHSPYSQVMGTEQALVVVGDPVGTADGAEGFIAEQPHFAFLVCHVGISIAVHLLGEHTTKHW